MGYASNHKAPSLTVGDYPADPNDVDGDDSQVDLSNRNTSLIHGSKYRGIAAAFVLSLVGPPDATASIVVWVRDENTRDAQHPKGRWIPWSPETDLTTVSGVVSNPGIQAPPVDSEVYVQLTAVANNPTALYVGYCPTAG